MQYKSKEIFSEKLTNNIQTCCQDKVPGRLHKVDQQLQVAKNIEIAQVIKNSSKKLATFS